MPKCLFLYPMDWTRLRKTQVSCHNSGSNKAFCWSGLARSIVSRVIGTLHFASCIVAGKKQCVNIIKKKITWSIFETVIILLACVSVTILCLIKRVFSTPAARSEFDRRICLTRDDRPMQDTEVWLSQFQACTSPFGYLSGICHFVLEKLQTPHGGAGRSNQNPTEGIKNRVQITHPGQHQNCSFQ